MKNTVLISKLTVILFTFLLMFSSCMVTRTTVGSGPSGKMGKTEVYSKAKQTYLFWGLVRLGTSQPAIPEDKNFQLKTSFNVFDAIITSITGGILSMQTVKVLVNEQPKN